MRRYFILVAVVTALVSMSAVATAQVFYAYPGAPVVNENHPMIGSCIGIGDDLFRINGYARFNVSPEMDFGLELVFDRFEIRGDSEWRYGAAGDIKYAIVPKDATMPFDLSINAGFGLQSGNDLTNIAIPIGGMISRPLELSSGRVLVPYGGVYLLLEHYSWDTNIPGQDNSETETDVEIRGGLNFNVDDRADLFAAIHLGAGDKFYIGLNWHL